ncbi:MAG: S24/S26 family peptidase [Ardenticatenales bacterium]|nr:S24/S26 family peptidase [Ardenticatenales bacterium]
MRAACWKGRPLTDEKRPWAEPRFQTRRWITLFHDQMARHGHMRWTVQGDSMVPTLPAGAEIDVVPLQGAPPWGALLLFAKGRGAVVHRYVGRRGDSYFTQADGHMRPDGPLEAGQIIGLVRAAWWNGEAIWPTRAEPMWRAKWLLRYQWLRARRRLARWRR